MVFIGWEEGKRSMVPQDQVPSRLLKTQSSSSFKRHGIETFEGWIRIQYAQPEWYALRLAMYRWEFTILGDRWTIYKHAAAYEHDWQTHQDFMEKITGQGHQQCVDGLQWYVIDRAAEEFKDIAVHTVDGVRSPFDPDLHNWVLPHGILLMEPHKQWKKMLAFVITQTWKSQLGARLYRPLATGTKGLGYIALEESAREVDATSHGYGTKSSMPVSASHETPWWQSSGTQNAWTDNDGSNFDVQVSDATASHLSGLPAPPPWSVGTGKKSTSYWQTSSSTPDHSRATNSVTQSSGERASRQYDDPWAQHDDTKVAGHPSWNAQQEYKPQEDASMEPVRQDTGHTEQHAGLGRATTAAVPTLPLHQLRSPPSLMSQLAGYQPPADDPMDVDRDFGQGMHKPAPSTPTDAQVTDVDEAGSEVPTQCTHNPTVLPPEEQVGMWRHGRFHGTVPTLPLPKASKPPPGLEGTAPMGGVPSYAETAPAVCPMSRRLEQQQYTILRALYEEFRVTSAKADRAREAERLAKQRFEHALLTAPKPGVVDQHWIDTYIASLQADV